MGYRQQFPAAPSTQTAVVSVANTNRNGTGTLVTLFTAGQHGSVVSQVDVSAVGATTDGMIRIFVSDNASTPNVRLLRELPVDTVADPSASTPAFAGVIDLRGVGGEPLEIPAGLSLKASTEIGETFHLTARGSDY